MACTYLGVTTRRFRQFYIICKKTQIIPTLGANAGRPKTTISSEHKQVIIEEWTKHGLSALYLENMIALEEKKKIHHNTIQKIMLEYCLASEQNSKQKRRKPRVRYEREHSLVSYTYGLAYQQTVIGKQVCAVLDDASRKVLLAGEFSNAKAENSN